MPQLLLSETRLRRTFISLTKCALGASSHIPHDKFSEISARIAQREAAHFTEMTTALKEQHVRDKESGSRSGRKLNWTAFVPRFSRRQTLPCRSGLPLSSKPRLLRKLCCSPGSHTPKKRGKD